MVQTSGFEPPTFGATIRRSNQLSYVCLPVARNIGSIFEVGKSLGTSKCKKSTTLIKKSLVTHCNYVVSLCFSAT